MHCQTILQHYLYQWFSNYGSSAIRPIIWLFVFAGITATWSYTTNGAMPVIRTPILGDWRESVYKCGNEGNRYRSLILAAQPMVNPLSIFGTKSVVVPKTKKLAFWISVQSILSVVMIALSIFAIRRRFKLH